jgi:hypothetical protein
MPVRTKDYTDPLTGTRVVQETIVQVGSPLWLRKVAVAEATNGREYPYVGTANTFAASASSGATTVQLNSTAFGGTASTADAPVDPTGMVLVILTGSAAGDYRTITGWSNHASRIVTLDRGVSAALTTSDKYRLAVPCANATELVVESEFSSNTAAPEVATIAVRVYPMPVGPALAQAAPHPSAMGPYTLVNTGVQQDTHAFAGDWYHGDFFSTAAKGAYLASVVVITKPANGTLDLWLGSI